MKKIAVSLVLASAMALCAIHNAADEDEFNGGGESEPVDGDANEANVDTVDDSGEAAADGADVADELNDESSDEANEGAVDSEA